MLTGHVTLISAGRTRYQTTKYHIYGRDIDVNLNRHPTTNLTYKFKSCHNHPLAGRLKASRFCLNLPPQKIEHNF